MSEEELAINKLKLLLNDLKINQDKEKEEGKGYFNNELVAIRVKEVLKIVESND